MAWLVFGLFFLASDHAPWWVYLLFVAGFLFDLWKEWRAERSALFVETIHHASIVALLRRILRK